MHIAFLYNTQNEVLYLKWGFTAGAFLVAFGFFIGYIGNIFIPDTASSPYGFLALWIYTNLALVIIYPILLYFILKKVDSIVSNMNKYSVAIYTLAGIMVTSTILSSIIAKTFVFSGLGLLPLIITFIVPAFYRIK